MTGIGNEEEMSMRIRKSTALVVSLALLLGLVFFVMPASAESSLETIKNRGKLLAGVKFDTVPFGFVDDKNQVVGFDVDLVREIAKKLGVEVEFVRVTVPTRIPMLAGGNVDMVAASMTHTVERDRTIDFSKTYYIGGQSILVKKGSGINSVKDLDGKSAAVQQGTTLEKNLAKIQPGAKQLAFKDYTSAWLALKQGRADALTGSHHILLGFAKESPEFQLAGARFSVEPFGMGVSQGDSDLRDLINETLQEVWKSGTYKKLYNKWFGADPDFEMDLWP